MVKEKAEKPRPLSKSEKAAQNAFLSPSALAARRLGKRSVPPPSKANDVAARSSNRQRNSYGWGGASLDGMDTISTTTGISGGKSGRDDDSSGVASPVGEMLSRASEATTTFLRSLSPTSVPSVDEEPATNKKKQEAFEEPVVPSSNFFSAGGSMALSIPGKVEERDIGDEEEEPTRKPTRKAKSKKAAVQTPKKKKAPIAVVEDVEEEDEEEEDIPPVDNEIAALEKQLTRLKREKEMARLETELAKLKAEKAMSHEVDSGEDDDDEEYEEEEEESEPEEEDESEMDESSAPFAGRNQASEEGEEESEVEEEEEPKPERAGSEGGQQQQAFVDEEEKDPVEATRSGEDSGFIASSVDLQNNSIADMLRYTEDESDVHVKGSKVAEEETNDGIEDELVEPADEAEPKGFLAPDDVNRTAPIPFHHQAPIRPGFVPPPESETETAPKALLEAVLSGEIDENKASPGLFCGALCLGGASSAFGQAQASEQVEEAIVEDTLGDTLNLEKIDTEKSYCPPIAEAENEDDTTANDESTNQDDAATANQMSVGTENGKPSSNIGQPTTPGEVPSDVSMEPSVFAPIAEEADEPPAGSVSNFLCWGGDYVVDEPAEVPVEPQPVEEAKPSVVVDEGGDNTGSEEGGSARPTQSSESQGVDDSMPNTDENVVSPDADYVSPNDSRDRGSSAVPATAEQVDGAPSNKLVPAAMPTQGEGPTGSFAVTSQEVVAPSEDDSPGSSCDEAARSAPIVDEPADDSPVIQGTVSTEVETNYWCYGSPEVATVGSKQIDAAPGAQATWSQQTEVEVEAAVKDPVATDLHQVDAVLSSASQPQVGTSTSRDVAPAVSTTVENDEDSPVVEGSISAEPATNYCCYSSPEVATVGSQQIDLDHGVEPTGSQGLVSTPSQDEAVLTDAAAANAETKVSPVSGEVVPPKSKSLNVSEQGDSAPALEQSESLVDLAPDPLQDEVVPPALAAGGPQMDPNTLADASQVDGLTAADLDDDSPVVEGAQSNEPTSATPQQKAEEHPHEASEGSRVDQGSVSPEPVTPTVASTPSQVEASPSAPNTADSQQVQRSLTNSSHANEGSAISGGIPPTVSTTAEPPDDSPVDEAPEPPTNYWCFSPPDIEAVDSGAVDTENNAVSSPKEELAATLTTDSQGDVALNAIKGEVEPQLQEAGNSVAPEEQKLEGGAQTKPNDHSSQQSGSPEPEDATVMTVENSILASQQGDVLSQSGESVATEKPIAPPPKSLMDLDNTEAPQPEEKKEHPEEDLVINNRPQVGDLGPWDYICGDMGHVDDDLLSNVQQQTEAINTADGESPAADVGREAETIAVKSTADPVRKQGSGPEETSEHHVSDNPREVVSDEPREVDPNSTSEDKLHEEEKKDDEESNEDGPSVLDKGKVVSPEMKFIMDVSDKVKTQVIENNEKQQAPNLSPESAFLHAVAEEIAKNVELTFRTNEKPEGASPELEYINAVQRDLETLIMHSAEEQGKLGDFSLSPTESKDLPPEMVAIKEMAGVVPQMFGPEIEYLSSVATDLRYHLLQNMGPEVGFIAYSIMGPPSQDQKQLPPSQEQSPPHPSGEKHVARTKAVAGTPPPTPTEDKERSSMEHIPEAEAPSETLPDEKKDEPNETQGEKEAKGTQLEAVETSTLEPSAETSNAKSVLVEGALSAESKEESSFPAEKTRTNIPPPRSDQSKWRQRLLAMDIDPSDSTGPLGPTIPHPVEDKVKNSVGEQALVSAEESLTEGGAEKKQFGEDEKEEAPQSEQDPVSAEESHTNREAENKLEAGEREEAVEQDPMSAEESYANKQAENKKVGDGNTEEAPHVEEVLVSLNAAESPPPVDAETKKETVVAAEEQVEVTPIEPHIALAPEKPEPETAENDQDIARFPVDATSPDIVEVSHDASEHTKESSPEIALPEDTPETEEPEGDTMGHKQEASNGVDDANSVSIFSFFWSRNEEQSVELAEQTVEEPTTEKRVEKILGDTDCVEHTASDAERDRAFAIALSDEPFDKTQLLEAEAPKAVSFAALDEAANKNDQSPSFFDMICSSPGDAVDLQADGMADGNTTNIQQQNSVDSEDARVAAFENALRSNDEDDEVKPTKDTTKAADEGSKPATEDIDEIIAAVSSAKSEVTDETVKSEEEEAGDTIVFNKEDNSSIVAVESH